MVEGPSLQARLAASLPKPYRFIIHHLSSAPAPSPAIYSAPPGQKPGKTSCESHFLSVSIPHNDAQLQIFALEILIYTTKHLTTLFVSKADSTGYIHLLRLPKGTPSPLKTISSIFISYLVEKHRHRRRQLVVSLFARAQDQYLFPGSIENPGKHVLDDRRLIKWWCRVLEPVLHPPSPPSNQTATKLPPSPQLYLRVPSCDIHETLSFFPVSRRHAPTWHPSLDPLHSLSPNPNIPERCLIPRFPDDPKSRFVDELDEELTSPTPPTEPGKEKESPQKGKRPGKWKSVNTLEEFWELMAFRQECSSGRLVGFLWGVFPPASPPASSGTASQQTLPTPQNSQSSSMPIPVASNTFPVPHTKADTLDPSSTHITFPQHHYARCIRLLLHLDYADLDIGLESSKRWIEDVGICAQSSKSERVGEWGVEVVGEKEALDGGDRGAEEGVGNGKGEGVTKGEGGANILGAGLVRKKKRGGEEGLGEGKEVGENGGGVNVLSTGLVRKKPKTK